VSLGTEAYLLRGGGGGCGVVAPSSGVHQDGEDE